MFNSILRYGWSLRHLMTTMEQFQPQREVHGLSSVASDTQSIEKGIPLADHANLDPFQAIFWQEISRAIVDQVGSQLFFVGRLDEFHQNYIATQSFLASLEALAPSKRTGLAWREHPSYIHFMKRWQLSAYFQIRYRIVATGLEAQLGPAHLPGSFAQAKLPLLAPTQAVLEAFASPWQDGVHLPPLISKQWRLSMMAVSRYSAWLEEQVPANVKFITAQHPSSTADATLPRSSMDGHSGLAAQIVATRGTSGTPARTSTPDAEAHAQDEETLKLLATVTADALWLEGELVTAFEREIEPKMQMPLSNAIDKSSMDGINDLRIEMREALLDTLPFRTEMLPGITHRLVSILKARCAEPLRLVRSVNTQYRSGASTPSAAPTTTTTSQVEPSYFIPQILRSLRIFFGKAERNEDASSSPMTPARLVPSADIKTAWATEVIDDVATKYAASLTQMIQNHESLKRLKRGNTAGMRGGLTGLASSLLRGGGGGGPGAAGASSASSSLSPASSSADKEDPEWEKMQAQMKADVAKLEDEVADLQAVGVNVKLDDSEAWRRLKEVVQVKSGRNL
jgi:conserved oligomeric Golgi complex subunit 2